MKLLQIWLRKITPTSPACACSTSLELITLDHHEIFKIVPRCRRLCTQCKSQRFQEDSVPAEMDRYHAGHFNHMWDEVIVVHINQQYVFKFLPLFVLSRVVPAVPPMFKYVRQFSGKMLTSFCVACYFPPSSACPFG